MLRGGLGEKEDAAQVDGDDAVEEGLVDLVDGVDGRDAGVVDEDVQLSGLRDGVVDDRAATVYVSDVQRQRQGVPAQSFGAAFSAST